MPKIFNHKSFNYLVWTPLGRIVNLKKHFCLQVHFKVSATWYCSHYLPPVLLTPVANLPPVSLIPMANCHRCRWYRRKFSTGINNTSQTFGKICRRCRWHQWQICRRCRWYRWCTFTCEYLREFSIKFKTVLMGYSGAGGKNLVTLSL